MTPETFCPVMHPKLPRFALPINTLGIVSEKHAQALASQITGRPAGEHHVILPLTPAEVDAMLPMPGM